MAITYQTTTLATPPSGTTVDIGSGAAGSGTQRVILCTDQAALPVTDNGGSLTVDGTVAATQSGTWSTRGQDGSGNALTSATRGSERALSVQIVDGSGAQVTTFGGSGGTASNFGSAFPATGTAAGITDGTNMVAPKAVAAAMDTTSGVAASGLVAQLDDVSTSTVTENQFAPLRLSSRRALLVEGVASGTVLPVSDGAGSLTVDNGGTFAVQAAQSGTWNVGTVTTVTGVTTVSTVTNVATIGTSVTPGTAAANLGKAEDAAHASGDTGVMALAVRTDSVAALAGTTGDYIPLITTSTGRLWASAVIDTALPAGTAALGTVTLDDAGTGWSISAASSANTTNATSAKGSAGRVHGWAVYNSNASPRYFKVFNKATAPTVGSDTPVLRVLIPAGGGSNISIPSPGVTLATGIAWCLTTGAADSDTGAVASNEIQVNLLYS